MDDLYKAAFTLDGQAISAFYNAEGNLVASARDISLLQLPLSLQTELRKKYQDYTVTNPFEVNNEEGTTYYATIETSSAKLELKSTSHGEWNTYKKSRI